MASLDVFAIRRLGVVLLPIVLFLGGHARADDGSTDLAQRVLRSQTILAEKLIQFLGQTKPNENIVVSPASLAGMLTAADLGAGPAVHDAIRRTLQIAPGSLGSQEMEALRAATIHAQGDANLTLATRLMFDRSEPPTAKALERLGRAHVETAVEDLHSPGALSDIDAWAAHATAGKITHVLDQIDPLDQMIALNALMFKARWAVEFRSSETRPADFYLASGQQVRTPFMHMHGPSRLGVREDEDFIGVQLPFGDGRYSMTILTTKSRPKTVTEFDDHLSWLAGESFEQRDLTFVDMPPFGVRSRADLIDPMRALDFDSNARFRDFTTAPLFLTSVTQIIDFNVNEDGAEVAAVTVGGFEVQGGIRFRNVTDVVVDKPFAYALRDTKTGAIVAAGFMTSVDGEVLAADASSVSASSPDVATAAEIEAEQIRQSGLAAEAASLPREAKLPGRLRVERDF